MFSRRGGYGGRSKATPNTTCQKCLQKGHYSYECTVTTQERPYKSRPSRTQQLLNPSLKPKLSEDVPTDLLRKKGLADKILAEKEEERRKKSGRRSPSASSVSDSGSVSTISTNRSQSRSRSPKRIENGKGSVRSGVGLGKRRRRSVSTASSASIHSQGRAERNTRRRLSSMSPEQRGRRRSRSRSSRMDMSPDEGSRQKKHDSPSRTYTRGRGSRRSRSRSRKIHGKRPVRHASLSRSPSRSLNRMDISDDRNLPQNGNSHASPVLPGRWGVSPKGRPVHTSRSRSPYRQRSLSPYSKRRLSRSPSPYKNRNGGMNGDGPRGGGRHRFDNVDRAAEPARAPAQPPAPARERSLSPYSKRVALTRQMQGGR